MGGVRSGYGRGRGSRRRGWREGGRSVGMEGVERPTRTALWRGRETALHTHCKNEYNRDLLIFRLPQYLVDSVSII